MQTEVTLPKKELFNPLEWPIPDPDREVPPSLTEKSGKIFMRLPARLLPQKPVRGKGNYTLVDQTNAAIEVQLENGCFRAVRMSGGAPFDPNVAGAPVARFSTYESFDAAFDLIASRAKFDFSMAA